MLLSVKCKVFTSIYLIRCCQTREKVFYFGNLFSCQLRSSLLILFNKMFIKWKHNNRISTQPLIIFLKVWQWHSKSLWSLILILTDSHVSFVNFVSLFTPCIKIWLLTVKVLWQNPHAPCWLWQRTKWWC